MEVETEQQELIQIKETSQSIGGNDVRQWLNREITPFLLKGMKQLVRDKESVSQGDELKWLGEFLIAENEKKKMTNGSS